jgi:hypothetical protein
MDSKLKWLALGSTNILTITNGFPYCFYFVGAARDKEKKKIKSR